MTKTVEELIKEALEDYDFAMDVESFLESDVDWVSDKIAPAVKEGMEQCIKNHGKALLENMLFDKLEEINIQKIVENIIRDKVKDLSLAELLKGVKND